MPEKKSISLEVKTEEPFRYSYQNIYPRGSTADQETEPLISTEIHSLPSSFGPEVSLTQ